MTSRREPQIGGQGPADPPMISGTPTRAIADARGAYLAGNLRALIGAMSREQQQRFRQGLVRLALATGGEVLRVEGRGIEEDALQAVSGWLVNPDPQSDSEVRSVAEEFYTLFDRGGVRHQGMLAYYVTLTASQDAEISAIAALQVVGMAKQLWGIPGNRSVEQVRGSAQQWELDAAWAILQGKPPPPIPVVEP